MTRVEIKGFAWGFVWEKAVSRALSVPVAGVLAAIDTDVYDAVSGGSIIDPGIFVTDADGYLPGFVEAGSYTISVDGGDPFLVEASDGSASGGSGPGPDFTTAVTIMPTTVGDDPYAKSLKIIAASDADPDGRSLVALDNTETFGLDVKNNGTVSITKDSTSGLGKALQVSGIGDADGLIVDDHGSTSIDSDVSAPDVMFFVKNSAVVSNAITVFARAGGTDGGGLTQVKGMLEIYDYNGNMIMRIDEGGDLHLKAGSIVIDDL